MELKYKISARKKLRAAVKNGKVIKPTECELCGEKCSPQGHHEDYDYPLDVNWLCITCHHDRHYEIVRDKQVEQVFRTAVNIARRLI